MKTDRALILRIKKSCELTIKYNKKEIEYKWKKSDNDGRYHDETSEEVARLEGESDTAYQMLETINIYLMEKKYPRKEK